MITQETVEKLKMMRLSTMAHAFDAQLKDPDYDELSFEERFGLLVDEEWTTRRERRLARLLKEAKFRIDAPAEDIDLRTSRGLDRSLLRSLLTGKWITDGRNALVIGPTGVGKTFLACALGNAACRQGFRTRYYRLPNLLQDLQLAQGDGTLNSLLSQLTRIQLLILDDWGLTPLTGDEARQLLEVIDARSMLRSTLVASQLPMEKWHKALGDPTVADAILDRLVHSSYRLIMKGESMRKVIPEQMSKTKDN